MEEKDPFAIGQDASEGATSADSSSSERLLDHLKKAKNPVQEEKKKKGLLGRKKPAKKRPVVAIDGVSPQYPDPSLSEPEPAASARSKKRPAAEPEEPLEPADDGLEDLGYESLGGQQFPEAHDLSAYPPQEMYQAPPPPNQQLPPGYPNLPPQYAAPYQQPYDPYAPLMEPPAQPKPDWKFIITLGCGVLAAAVAIFFGIMWGSANGALSTAKSQLGELEDTATSGQRATQQLDVINSSLTEKENENTKLVEKNDELQKEVDECKVGSIKTCSSLAEKYETLQSDFKDYKDRYPAN